MLTVLEHPLVDHWVAELRDASTPPPRFRSLVYRLSVALFLEASRGVATVPRPVTSPLGHLEGRRLAHPPLLVPILRAGLGMVDGIHELLPEARVAHVGIYRDHVTLAAVRYYTPEVPLLEGGDAFVLDPMLATGGSAAVAIEMVKGWGAARVHLLSIIGAPPGVERVGAAHPDVPILLAALDERLNDLGYIVPGLGDAGDRQFGG